MKNKLTNGFVFNKKTREVGVLDRQYYADYENKKDLTAYVKNINNTSDTRSFLIESEHDWENLELPLAENTAIDIVCKVQGIQIESLFNMVYELQSALNNVQVRFN